MTRTTVAMRLAAELTRAIKRDVGDESAMHAVERLVLDSAGCALGALEAAPVAAARSHRRRPRW